MRGGMSKTDGEMAFYCGHICKGYQQITSLGSAQSLTVPAGAEFAHIQTEAAPCRYRDDGTSPTASLGMYLGAGDSVWYQGDLNAIKLIQVSSGAILNISYYE